MGKKRQNTNCSICGVEKTFENAYVRKASSGFLSYCKKCESKRAREYHKANKVRVAAKSKVYRKENKLNISIKGKAYRETRKIEIATRHRAYEKDNKDKLLIKRRAYLRNRRASDPTYRLVKSLRSRLHHALKGTSKSEPTLKLLGCTPEELWTHLESKFTQGMSKKNHGNKGWHVDLTDPEQQKKCFNYTNLQPLWAEDNRKKGAKISWDS